MADEIDLKRVFWVSSVVDARLRDTFAPALVAEASVLLARLMGDDPHDDEDSEQAQCRLMLAAIRASEGDLVKLAAWIEVARSDPRDMIVAAEYRREMLGEGDDPRDVDLAEYLAWAPGR